MMWMILQAEKPEDWVIATGITTTVREFVRMAFNEVGIELRFEGKGIEEKAFVLSCKNPLYQIPKGANVISVDDRYFRPTEVDLLMGDASKAREKIGWIPEYSLNDLVKEMMECDLMLMQKEMYLKNGGYSLKNQFE
jgi:GDPmannose 4,6-dehydratase